MDEKKNLERPQITAQAIKTVIFDHYQLKIVKITELHAYLGRNYFLRDEKNQRYVFKLSFHSEKKEILKFENQVLDFLGKSIKSNFYPAVFKDKTKHGIIKIKDDRNLEFLGRLISFVPGRLLAETKPHSTNLLLSLGKFMGEMDKNLFEFNFPIPERNLKWDLQNAHLIKSKYKLLLKGPELTIVDDFINLFENIAIPNQSLLRKSLIHNDGNDYNLFTSMNDNGDQFLSGIIDFGDTAKTYTVAELAITVCYVMMNKKDPMASAVQVIRGYNSILPLKEKEIEVLFSFICMRLCVSVVYSAEAKQAEPENSYLSISEKPAWELLKTLHQINHRYAHYLFRDACGLPADPKSPIIVKWLKKNKMQFAPILNHNYLKTENIKVLDLSIESPDIKNPSQLKNLKKFSHELFENLKKEKKQLGIGKYDEPRLLYTTKQFKTASGNENRTFHLGIDLFVDPLTPVFLPLDGKICGFQKTGSPLDYGNVIIVEHQTDSIPFYTLYGHLADKSLDGLKVGRKLKKGEKLAVIGDFEENGNWPPHLHFQIITDLFNLKNNFFGVAAPSLRKFYKQICPDPNLILQLNRKHFLETALSKRGIKSLREKHICKNLSLNYNDPLHIVRGYMQHLYDSTGSSYLDTVNNVCHVGHSNPYVVDQIVRQAFVLNTNSRYYHQNMVKLAQKLLERLPAPLEVCFFVNSGSEANELAFRLAKTHTNSEEFIVVNHGYHGNTNLLIDISPYKFEGKGGFGKKPNVNKVDMPYPYRWEKGTDTKTCGEYYADQVKNAVEQINLKNKKPAAFICESIIGVGGQIILPEGYLQKSYDYIKSYGGVCIADEVQVGMGRVGSHFWGFELSEVIPDIVTVGKPLGNGHPLAAVITTSSIAGSFTNGMEYFNTFGGNPVSCAAGLAVFDYISQNNLEANALKTGNYLKKGLLQLQKKHKIIGDVRGAGLFLGIELVLDQKTKEPATAQTNYIVERMKTNGIFCSTEGPFDNIIKIKPPIVFSIDDANLYLTRMDQILLEDFCSLN